MTVVPPTPTVTPTVAPLRGIGKPARPAIIGNVFEGMNCDQAPVSPGDFSVEIYRESSSDADEACTAGDIQGDAWATTTAESSGTITFPSATEVAPESDWPPEPDNYCIRVTAPGSGGPSVEALLLVLADRDETTDVQAGNICINP